ncbi:UNVERIFIED_CONTAM: hypothetical protein PYX00_005301 [Menopon gallinae]|uniref:Centromere protein M n=1 Tax=Menopon gallinae TaxID=328185 RepID=A0AAW2HRN0_9NEOP
MMPASESNLRFKYLSGKGPESDTLQILLISTSQQCLDELQKSLYITRETQSERRPYNLNVHTCKHIKNVMELKRDEFTVDYIVYILDVNNKNCLMEVEENVNLLDISFGREKICMVNPNPSHGKSNVNMFDVWQFAHEKQFNIVNGRINDQERLTNLSNRILNLAEACCGIINGIPLKGYV